MKYEHGLTQEEVVEKIGEDRWDEFAEWMGGQTGAVADDGTFLYYPSDVERFIDGRPVID